MPTDVGAAIDAVVQGVRDGRFTQARVDSSVRRVLELKQRFGLDRRRLVDIDSVRVVVADTSHLAIAQLAAQKSITLAKDSSRLIPLAGAPRILSVTIANRTDLPAGATFNTELRRVSPTVRAELINPDDPTPNYGRLLALADSADVAIVSSYLSTSSTTATASAPEALAQFIRDLGQRKARTIVVSFGNPYFLQQIPTASTYLIAWGGFPMSQTAAARAIVGAAPITGKLPITIPPLLKFGAGEQRAASRVANP
jgi:beta-N-acetylhexosaminidase